MRGNGGRTVIEEETVKEESEIAKAAGNVHNFRFGTFLLSML